MNERPGELVCIVNAKGKIVYVGDEYARWLKSPLRREKERKANVSEIYGNRVGRLSRRPV